jgi:hypothetical protein
MRPLTQNFGVAVLFLLVGAGTAQAITKTAQGFLITIEPILGYEYTHRDTPMPHRSGMLIYGARFTAGRPHVAAEGEYTRGSDTEVFTAPVLSVNTTRENVRLGVRGTYDLAEYLDFILRLGGQASKAAMRTVDAGGISAATDTGWQIHPYLGAGLQIAAQKFFSLGLEANYVFYSLSDFTKNSVQLAASVRVHFNTR